MLITELWFKELTMLAALALETQRLISTYIDRVQAYRLHHVSKQLCSLLHGPIKCYDRAWSVWERGEMRSAEWEQLAPGSPEESDEDP